MTSTPQKAGEPAPLRPLEEEVTSLFQRLRFTAQGEWLTRYDLEDEEWLPPRMHLAFLRMGIVSPDESPEGGYMLTPLGLALVAEFQTDHSA